MKHRPRFALVASLLAASLLIGSFKQQQPERIAYADARAGSGIDSYAVFLNIDSAAGDRARGIAQLKRAIKLQNAGQHREAIAAFDKAAPDLPRVADWLTAFAAASAAHLGDTTEVRRRLAAVDEVVATQWAWRTRVRAFEKAGALQRALAIAKAATENGTSSKQAAAWLRVSELQRDLGDRAAQRAALLKATQTAPESEAALDAARTLTSFDDLASPEHLQVGRVLMRNGEVSQGARQLEQALTDDRLTEADRSQARYELGRMLFAAGRHADAARHLERVAATHERAPDARFLLGRAHYRQGNKDLGRDVFRKVTEQHPTSPAATRALFMLADLAHDEGALDDAAELFERAAATPSKADEAALAAMRRGGIAFAQGDYRAAASIFGTYRTAQPEGAYQTQATYWLALAKMRTGDEAGGRELLHAVRRRSPVSYYGMRAAALLGEPLAISELKEGPARDAAVHRQVVAGIERWQLLHEVGWLEAAAFELRRLKQHFAGNADGMYAMAEELNTRGAPHLGIGIGRDLVTAGRPWDRRLLRLMYPLPHLQLIQTEARRNGLDPYFVAALIRQESRFNTKAVSGAGAIGLMQVMPGTGKSLSRKTKVGTVTVARLTQPDVNVKLGTRFLADLVDMYGGRTDVVLIAYNAGPTRAYRWRNFPEFRSEDLFVERIPFDETRDYVKIVKLNTAIYRFLYDGVTAAD